MKSCSDEDSNTGDRSKMPLPWILRRYRDGDEQAILELLNTAFGKWHSLKYWKWWYTQNPAGSSVIWLAECDHKIIGHYGIVPITMKVGDAYVTGSFACDAAVHPDYQGKGLFSSIVNRMCLDAAENCIPLTYGFANTNSGPTYRRYERMGHVCFMIRMIRILDWEPLLSRLIRNECLAGTAATALRKLRRPESARASFAVETLSRFDERIDELWETLSNSYKLIVRRDLLYLNWRYVAHPEKDYTIYAAVKDHRILGYCILAREQRQNLRLGVVVDILGRPNVVDYLIRTAVQRFEQQGVHAVSAMMSERHPYTALFRRAGFIMQRPRNPALYVAINLPCSPIDEKEVYSQSLLLSQNRLLKEKSNWFMMSGDSDWPL